MIGTFVRWNRRLSKRITPDNHYEANVFGMYIKTATICMAQGDVHHVLDVGAGAFWQFPLHYKADLGLHLTGVDIDGVNLARNVALDERLECDVTRALPLPDAAIDLITVWSGIEHFSDNASFLRNCARVLRPGGRLVAQFPSRYAPFAVANRLLPPRFTRWLLARIMPGSEGVLGFSAHYDNTDYAAFCRIVAAAGLEVEYYYPGYFSSDYFGFFLPLYILSTAYDLLRFCLGVRSLASYNLFILRKPGPANELRLRFVDDRFA